MEDFEMKFRNGNYYPQTYNNVINSIRSAMVPIKSLDIERDWSVSGIVVRECVRFARRQGILIVSSPHGYRVSDDPIEIRKSIRGIENRIESMKNTMRIMEESLNELIRGTAEDRHLRNGGTNE